MKEKLKVVDYLNMQKGIDQETNSMSDRPIGNNNQGDDVPTQPVSTNYSSIYSRLRQDPHVTMMPNDWIPSPFSSSGQNPPSNSTLNQPSDHREYEIRLQQLERLIPKWAEDQESMSRKSEKSIAEQPLR